MRKLAQASTALLLSGASTAMAAGVDSSFGEARLYWRSTFGEQSVRPVDMNFGMSLDYDRRFSAQTLPLQPAAQVNFDRAGFVSASVNGMPFARRVTLQQAEGEGEAAAASSYTVVDYGLLALGAVGIGFGISEVVNQKDTRDAAAPAAPPGAQPPASPSPLPLPLPIPLPMPLPLPLPLPLPGIASSGGNSVLEERSVTPEYQQWLDAGTGGMGDLKLITE